MSKYRILLTILILAITPAVMVWCTPQGRDNFSKFDVDRSRKILRDAYENVKRSYYDPSFHGMDWDARYHKYEGEMNGATSYGDAFSIIADFLDGLGDSHTFFEPPSRAWRVEYGYRLQMVGEKSYITRVRPGTDAESKVHPGDQVVSVNGFGINRAIFWKVNYILNALAPVPATRFVLRDPTGTSRQVNVISKTQPLKKVMDLTSANVGFDLWQLIRQGENLDHQSRQRHLEVGDVMIWKMPEFNLDSNDVDRLFGIARKQGALILDLRGNGGGYEETLTRMVGNLFDHDVKIADRTGRKEEKPLVAKSVGAKAFSGKLVVLIDSESASASELLARVIQLENRGTVLGDESSGYVMQARGYPCSEGLDVKIFYAFSITDADLIMKDGKSLEHLGVKPDELLLPTAEDLASGRDPVLARAAEIVGLKLDPVAAGKAFPIEWLPF